MLQPRAELCLISPAELVGSNVRFRPIADVGFPRNHRVVSANDWQFQLLGLAFMTVVAVWPRQVIRVASRGKAGEISQTGVIVLRLIGGLSALSFLYDLVEPRL